jgi:hypothetical protein
MNKLVLFLKYFYISFDACCVIVILSACANGITL